MITAFVAIGLAIPQPASLALDVLEAGLGIDNRIGFQFASLSIGSEDGSDSTISGSSARITTIAKLMKSWPDTKLLIEGHVGMSAPAEIAQSYSEHRAHVVATTLVEEHGVSADQILTRGWGSRISQAAQTSDHPNAQAAKAGFGWAEIFFAVPPCGHTTPPRPDYYFERDEEEVAEPAVVAAPPPAPRTLPSSHPIFYMHPGVSTGERVGLHLFEPRYKLLLQRALATDKTFIYCRSPPLAAAARGSFDLPLKQDLATDGCAAVVIEQAQIFADGQADIVVRAVASLTLHEVMLEPHTGGLFSTTDASRARWLPRCRFCRRPAQPCPPSRRACSPTRPPPPSSILRHPRAFRHPRASFLLLLCCLSWRACSAPSHSSSCSSSACSSSAASAISAPRRFRRFRARLSWAERVDSLLVRRLYLRAQRSWGAHHGSPSCGVRACTRNVNHVARRWYTNAGIRGVADSTVAAGDEPCGSAARLRRTGDAFSHISHHLVHGSLTLWRTWCSARKRFPIAHSPPLLWSVSGVRHVRACACRVVSVGSWTDALNN